MSETDAAYAAGLFDGEGHIAIIHSKGYGNGKGKYPRYQLQISMSQNEGDALRWLESHYGGSVRFVSGKRSYDEGRYYRYNWSLSTQSAASFLKHIQPYAIVKAEEIKIALSFQNTMRETGRAKVSSAILDLRHLYFEQIRQIRKTRNAEPLPTVCQSDIEEMGLL